MHTPSAFVPLRVRSHGSLLHGTAAPEALVTRALELGCHALALTDRDNLYLAIRFYRAAHAEGLTPLLGAEITPVAAGGPSALLLALDRRGYAHLCEVISARHLDAEFDLVPALRERSEGLHVVVESPALATALLAAGIPPADHEGAVRHAGVPPRPGGLWVGVRGVPSERSRLAERVAAARRLGIPLVATGEVALLQPRDHDLHRVAVTAARGELLERMPPDAFAAREAWLASPAEWARRVRAVCAGAGLPDVAEEALAHNTALASRCRLEIELGRPIFPHAPVPRGESGQAWLARLGRAGVRRRYGRGVPGGASRSAGERTALRRLESELAMIERLGFTDYFLLVAGIVEFARARGIPSVGRGSGASSMVSYCLGITNVDPIRHDLCFERFLHPTRRDCPDLDIDLCWKRRDEVITHVYQTYGAERVAMIATHATLGARSAFRETAKALGVSNARVNQLARRVPRALPRPYLEHLRELPQARGIDWSEPPLAEALRLAEGLEGAPRHLSVHCGGIVIGDRPLTHYVPLESAAKQVIVTQFEMRAIEAIGLVKMDLLGNRALTEIGQCVELVREHRGERVEIERIPENDPATAARLASGDTMNCFQLESPAMRHLLRMLRCGTLEETIAAVALIRPGAAESGMKEAFCRRHRGLEPASYLHPRLARVLGGTHGVMLYEEDVMRVASVLAGLSLGEGDDLRRAIGNAGHAPGDPSNREQALAALERGFVGRCVANGVAPEPAAAAWRALAQFAGYAFCKAHAAGYGTLGWQTAWLKTHYAAEFTVGVMNHHAGMYATWVHVEDLRRHGVVFRAPCVARSAWDTTLERDGAVRVGLARVFGLAAATGERILAARAAKPFASLADFADRARPTLPELESLILAGALDLTARTRAALLLEARVAAAQPAPGSRARTRAAISAPALVSPDGADVMPDAVSPLPLPELPELDAVARFQGEFRSTGLWFGPHPLDLLVPADAFRDVTPAAAIDGMVGKRVTVIGLPCASRTVETKAGAPMLFLTLADRSGLAEAVLFPDAWRRNAAGVRGQVVRVEGRIDETLGAVTITVERATAIA